MLCYPSNRYNEGDEQAITQPKMYNFIKEHRSVRKIYTETLLRKGDIDPKEAEEWLDQFQGKLQQAFDRTREETTPPSQGNVLYTDEEITGFQKEASPDTSISQQQLEQVGRALVTTPEGFTIHPKLKAILAKRQAMVEGKEPLDWAFGELMAFGSLLLDGHRVRLSGQDSGRGTFSQRHALLFDYITGQGYVPLNALNPSPGASRHALPQAGEGEAEVDFAVYDSLLSEYGVLG